MTPPDSADLVGRFVAPLNGLALRYMVTGGVAAIVYGDPRMTRDIDVVADIRPSDASRFAAAFPEPAYYVAPPEVIREEAGRHERGHFNVIHVASAMKADVYVAGQDPLHAWALARRVAEEVSGVPIWLAPVEYVIVRKLQWSRDGGSSRHLDDIRAIMRINGDLVNRSALDDWIGRLGLHAEWAALR